MTQHAEISFIIPVYNEEAILNQEIVSMINTINTLLPELSYEILLVENGSNDRTKDIGRSLEKTFKQVRMLSLPTPGYGKALKHGVLEATGYYIVLFNIDLWDIKFVQKALFLCDNEKWDIIVGSKTMRGSRDERPFLRKLITKFFNIFLRWFFNFKGTDTHGVKFLRREEIAKIVEECKTEQEVFDTEFLLRSQYKGLKIKEIPVIVKEKRKTRYAIITRVPRTIRDLFILNKHLHHGM